MTFQNMCSIFRCTHEESLALWDYLMFLRIKSMLRQPPLPAITKEDMEFEKAREASPLMTQRWMADIFGVPVELTNTIEQDKPKVHVGTQQWFDDMEAIRQGKKAPGDTAPPLSALADEVREALKKEKAAAQAYQLTREPPYPPKTKAEYLEKKLHMEKDRANLSNCCVALSKVEAQYRYRPVDTQMLLCHKCHEELYFGRVKDGTDIVCFQCGTMTKFQYEEPEVSVVDKVVGISEKAKMRYDGIIKWVGCPHCKSVLHFYSASTRVDVTCYNCGSIVQYIDVVEEEEKE